MISTSKKIYQDYCGSDVNHVRNGIPPMYEPNERPFGKSWEEWTIRWWQWFFSIPKPDHPAYDDASEKSTLNQNHPNTVFLAGTTGGSIERTIAIPAGKALLFPIINFASSYSEDPSFETDTELVRHAKSNIDDIISKEASINGIKMVISEKFRVQSPPFNFSFPTNNIYGVQDGLTRGAGDGYWIFLKPLCPGKHFIQTSGSCLSGKIQIHVSTRLVVYD